MKPFAPLQRQVKESFAYFSNEPTMLTTSKNDINGWLNYIDKLPLGHKCTVAAARSTSVRPCLHLVGWTTHNEELSYFEAAHMVHSFGCRLQLNLQLGPPLTSVLLQEWPEVVNSSKLLLSLSCCALSMISYSPTRHPILKAQREIPQPEQYN